MEVLAVEVLAEGLRAHRRRRFAALGRALALARGGRRGPFGSVVGLEVELLRHRDGEERLLWRGFYEHTGRGWDTSSSSAAPMAVAALVDSLPARAAL